MDKYSLDELPLNENGYIIDLKSQGRLRRRMLDLGLIKNTKIKPIFISSSGDPRAYEVRGSVIARYIDSNGNVISEETRSEGDAGTLYSTVKKDIPGYTYKNVFGNENGYYIDGEIVVIYIYDKQTETQTGKLIVHYVDENGSKLLDDKITESSVGDSYQTIKESIVNYESFPQDTNQVAAVYEEQRT